MTEERVRELLDDAARTYRVPPEPDLEAMWSAIERDAFDIDLRSKNPRKPSWRVFSLGLAAALVMGVALGQSSLFKRAASEGGNMAAASNDTPNSNAPDAYTRTATELLGKTAVLLTTLPSEGEAPRADERFTTQALELLTTTRLLLDSPAASDPRFADLLEDLELVLAQIASLRSGRNRQEIELITDALQERDVVPRIQSAVARLASGD
jgi:hypothetical protein